MKTVGASYVLIIAENTSQIKTLATKLGHAGYIVEVVENGPEALQLAKQRQYGVIILDQELPDISGMDICRCLRRKGVTTPLLMVSSSLEKVSLIRCLELGADDYLIKPFSHNELIARLRALVRRDHRAFASFWAEQCGIRLDIAASTVYVEDRAAKLTKKETQLLRRLMIEAPEILPREMLLQDVWGIDDAHTSNRLDVYIRRLRWKLEQLTEQHLIHTIRGQGYYFADELIDEETMRRWH